MTPYELPLQATPQSLTIELAGSTYQLTVRWNTVAVCWVMDIADSAGVPLVQGIPLVTGADLLEQLGYLEIGGALVCQTDTDLMAPPTFTNLGSTGHVFFVVLP